METGTVLMMIVTLGLICGGFTCLLVMLMRQK